MIRVIESLIKELPQASSKRVEEILTILEGVLSDVECNLPSEDDTDSAYECQIIPNALDKIALIRAWNARDTEFREREIKTINKLAEELNILFKQIPLVNTDSDQ